jgi:uncharacterized membrane protein
MKWISWMIVAIALLMSAALYRQLPESMPIHWNLAGEVDRYASKSTGAFMLPLVMVALAVMFETLPRVSPRGFAIDPDSRGYRAIALTSLLALLVIHAFAILTSIGVPIDMTMAMPLMMGALFVVIGNYITTVRKNFFVGIRTPWTLANDDVWFRTHRLGGRLFMLGGLVLMAAAFLGPKAMFAVLMGVIVLVAGVPIVYSYVVYRRLADEKR